MIEEYMPKLTRPDSQWREQLTQLEYQVLRQGGTEAPFTGEYTDTVDEGVYECRACGAELFRSTTKFASHCGWPSFFAPLAEERVRYLEDRSIPGRALTSPCPRPCAWPERNLPMAQPVCMGTAVRPANLARPNLRALSSAG